MAVKGSIAITNSSTDVLYVDSDQVIQAKRNIKNDLTNIVNTLNNIEKHYKELANHKATKGKWKEVADSCVKASNKYEKKMEQDKTSLENAVDDGIQKYVLSQIEALQAAQSAADTIV